MNDDSPAVSVRSVDVPIKVAKTAEPHPRYAKRKPVAQPRVLLIRPPQLFFYGVWPRGPRLAVPIGLLSIGSFLKTRGVDVRIYDCFVEGEDFKGDQWNPHKASQGSIVRRWMRHYEDGGETPLSLKHVEHQERYNRRMHHFGASWDRLREDLRKFRPDVVGITNLFRENTEETLRCADIVRQELPDALIAVGGPNATALPDYMLERCEAIDAIGTGDGEYAMLELVEFAQGKRAISEVSGVVYRGTSGYLRPQTSRQVTELDEFGELDYDLIKLERYFSYERAGIMARNKFAYEGAERSVSLVTSRGCPYKCSFCSIHIHAGRKYRRYSVEHTLNHLKTLTQKYGVKHVHFEDDNLTLDRDRFMRFMNGVLKMGLKFTWDTPNGVFANTLDEEMLRIMKKSGCIYLIIGVESGDQWVLDNVIHKQPLTLDRVINAFKLGKQIGIDMHAFYIIGFPRETRKHIETTLKFAMDGLKNYDVVPHVALARADPGTDLFKEAKEGGTLLSDYSILNVAGVHADYFIRHLIKTDEFSPEDLEKYNERFHGQAIRVIAQRTALFLLKHPWIAITSAAYYLKSVFKDGISFRDAVVKLFFCRLFYRNALTSLDPARIASGDGGGYTPAAPEMAEETEQVQAG